MLVGVAMAHQTACKAPTKPTYIGRGACADTMRTYIAGQNVLLEVAGNVRPPPTNQPDSALIAVSGLICGGLTVRLRFSHIARRAVDADSARLRVRCVGVPCPVHRVIVIIRRRSAALAAAVRLAVVGAGLAAGSGAVGLSRLWPCASGCALLACPILFYYWG